MTPASTEFPAALLEPSRSAPATAPSPLASAPLVTAPTQATPPSHVATKSRRSRRSRRCARARASHRHCRKKRHPRSARAAQIIDNGGSLATCYPRSNYRFADGWNRLAVSWERNISATGGGGYSGYEWVHIEETVFSYTTSGWAVRANGPSVWAKATSGGLISAWVDSSNRPVDPSTTWRVGDGYWAVSHRASFFSSSGQFLSSEYYDVTTNGPGAGGGDAFGFMASWWCQMG